jgi:hypothetical protein
MASDERQLDDEAFENVLRNSGCDEDAEPYLRADRSARIEREARLVALLGRASGLLRSLSGGTLSVTADAIDKELGHDR